MSDLAKIGIDGVCLAAKTTSVRLTRLLKLRTVSVLVDRRRSLPHVIQADGEGFRITVVTDSSRRARDFAYDLAGWTANSSS